MSTLYWAYGSNLNVVQMKSRCPNAKVITPLNLEGRLVFRGVADVEPCPDSIVPGGLWRITPACEVVLDRYEGVSGGLYSKRYLKLRLNGRVEKCLYYTMNSSGIMPPYEPYLETIVQGYKDFRLPLEVLEEAVARSWGEKHKTPDLKRRYLQKGRPALARVG